MKARYMVTSRIPKWDFINGYSCDSEDMDHFIRHLGYRFNKLCSMNDLNNAHYSNDIHVERVINKLQPESIHITPRVIDHYWDDFGYTIELDSGSAYEAIIEKKQFTNDIEAFEWLNSHK